MPEAGRVDNTWSTHGMTTHMKTCKLGAEVGSRLVSCGTCCLNVCGEDWAHIHANNTFTLDLKEVFPRTVLSMGGSLSIWSFRVPMWINRIGPDFSKVWFCFSQFCPASANIKRVRPKVARFGH